MLKKVLPRRLIRLRMARQVTQRQFAEECGIAASTMNDLESGLVRDLKVSTLVKLCRRLSVTPDHLLGFDKAEPPRTERSFNDVAETIRAARHNGSANVLPVRGRIPREWQRELLRSVQETKGAFPRTAEPRIEPARAPGRSPGVPGKAQ